MSNIESSILLRRLQRGIPVPFNDNGKAGDALTVSGVRLTEVDAEQLPSQITASVAIPIASGFINANDNDERVVDEVETPPEVQKSFPRPMARKQWIAEEPGTLRIDCCVGRHDNGDKKYEESSDTKQQQHHLVRILSSHYGTSSAMNGMDDKDEFFRTLEKCNCTHLSPPSELVAWDFDKDELKARIDAFLSMNGHPTDTNVVLKTPMGSCGAGVFFIAANNEDDKYSEAWNIISQNYFKAMSKIDGFIDRVCQSGNQTRQIPSWVLQKEIRPPLLIAGNRKFHIRSYVVVMEDKADNDDVKLHVFIYNRHEIRIASVPVATIPTAAESVDINGPTSPDNWNLERDRNAHITNGAGSVGTTRCLLHDVQELNKSNIQEQLELFLARAFGVHLIPEMTDRVRNSYTDDKKSDSPITKHAMAGVDIMMDAHFNFWILEVNVNPAAPPEEVLTPQPSTISDTMHYKMDFRHHLIGFMTDFFSLLLHRSTNVTTQNHNPAAATSHTNNNYHSEQIYNFKPMSKLLTL